MGAWGVLPFDNDDANAWAYGLDRVTDLSLVEAAFAAVDEADMYLDAADGSNALVACEVLARLLGNFGYQNSYTDKVDRWVIQNPQRPPAELLAHANWVINMVVGPQSELSGLWEEPHRTAWLEAIESLRQRLRG